MLQLRPGVAAACESSRLRAGPGASLAGPFGPLSFYVDRYGFLFRCCCWSGWARRGRAGCPARSSSGPRGRRGGRARRDSGGARPSGRTCRARPGRGPTAPRLPRPGGGRGARGGSRGGRARGVRCPSRGRPTPGGGARPARHQLRARKKMAARRPRCRQLKMEDAVARESGRVSHPHKGKEPSPLRPPLPATPRGTGRRLGPSLLRVAFGVRLGSAGGGDFWAMELTHLVGGDCRVRPAWHWM